MKKYNPLDFEEIATSIANAMRTQGGPHPLPPRESFPGEGVYSIFYKGDFDLYQIIKNRGGPIYVGKAVSPGSRKGEVSTSLSKPLHGRLVEHSISIRSVSNLRTEDFFCHFLLMDDVWISMAERFLIRTEQPLWNCCLEGFGAHNPGAGRVLGEVSWWDTLHPGRPWTEKLQKVKQVGEAELMVRRFLGA